MNENFVLKFNQYFEESVLQFISDDRRIKEFDFFDEFIDNVQEAFISYGDYLNSIPVDKQENEIDRLTQFFLIYYSQIYVYKADNFTKDYMNEIDENNKLTPKKKIEKDIKTLNNILDLLFIKLSTNVKYSKNKRFNDTFEYLSDALNDLEEEKFEIFDKKDYFKTNKSKNILKNGFKSIRDRYNLKGSLDEKQLIDSLM